MYFTNINKNIFIACVLLLGFSSCKKFLASYSQNNSFVQTANDLDELLIGEGYENYNNRTPYWMGIMDDDAAMGRATGSLQNSITAGYFYWQADPRIDLQGKVDNNDEFFKRLYLHISRLNTVLYNVPLLRQKGEPADQLKRISGEAHFLRAYLYFMLVNVYGKPWQKASAQSDYGVPLKTEAQVEDRFFERSSVSQVYNQIVTDLQEAEKELEGSNSSTPIRANLAAAQALLCRVWLYQEEYEKVISYADKLLNNPLYKLSDLNNYVEGTDFNTRSSTETIFSMGSPFNTFLMVVASDRPISEFYRVSDDLAAAYSPEDLRLKAFYVRNSEGILRIGKIRRESPNNTDVSDSWLIRLPELYLNKAEAQAMLGRDQDAITTIQKLRKARFRPADLSAISSGGEVLVNFIRNERRRELSFESHRWFDLRRYAVNQKWPFSKTIRHDAYSFGPTGYFQDGYYELKPYEQDKAAYVIPISRDEIEFNNGALKNEARPQRTVKH